jgi:hypothetical protein
MLKLNCLLKQIYIHKPMHLETALIYSAWKGNVKSKAVPLQAWSDPEGSRKLKFPDFMTTTQDGG